MASRNNNYKTDKSCIFLVQCVLSGKITKNSAQF